MSKIQSKEAILKAIRGKHDIFQSLRVNGCLPGLPCPTKLSLQIDGEIRTLQGKHKFRQFVTTKPELQKTLKRMLYI